MDISEALEVYNPPINFRVIRWLVYVPWCKIAGQVSRNNSRLR